MTHNQSVIVRNKDHHSHQRRDTPHMVKTLGSQGLDKTTGCFDDGGYRVEVKIISQKRTCQFGHKVDDVVVFDGKIRHCFFRAYKAKMANCVPASAVAQHIETPTKCRH